MGMTDKMGTMHRAPTLGKIRKDKGIITPTLVLPPRRRGRRYRSLVFLLQGGGDLKVNPSLFRGRREIKLNFYIYYPFL